MIASSCLKMQINDMPPTISYINEGDYSNALDILDGSSVEALTVLSHLLNFFFTKDDWVSHVPPASPLNPVYRFILGVIYDSVNLEGHSEGSVSLTAMSGDEGVQLLSHLIGMSQPALAEELRGKDITQVSDILSGFGIRNFNILPSEVSLKFFRCTPEDIEQLPRSEGYVDAFPDLVGMTYNSDSAVEGLGFSKFTYNEPEDYLEFKTGCGIGFISESGLPCSPTTTYFKPSAFTNSGSTMSARYRVNGGSWVDYSREHTDDYPIAGEFLESILENDRIVIVGASGGRGAFKIHEGNGGISGAPSSDTELGTVYDSEFKTTIDFQVVGGDSNDIVWVLMGEDFTIESCSLYDYNYIDV